MKFFPSKLKMNKGYTLLFAVLVSSLVLGIGISILSISQKEFLLSSSARDSTTSLYAADSGVECAVYGDTYFDSFSTSTTPTGSLLCGESMGPVPSMQETFSGSGIYMSTFSVTFAKNGGSCATITVQKSYVNNSPQTAIDVRGYNLGWDKSNLTCDIQGAKKVERAFLLTY